MNLNFLLIGRIDRLYQVAPSVLEITRGGDMRSGGHGVFCQDENLVHKDI